MMNDEPNALDFDVDYSKSKSAGALKPAEKPDEWSTAVNVLDGDDQIKLDESSRPKASMFSFKYYQSFFDVDTNQVVKRLTGALVPSPKYLKVGYLDSHLRPLPDLYGPVWVCFTLIIAVAIGANIASYLQHQGDYVWSYDFHKVTLASSVVFLYIIFIPMLIYWVLWTHKMNDTLSFLDIVSLYGYSLSWFVIASLIWVFKVSYLQWIVLAVVVVCSGYVLVTSIYCALNNCEQRGTVKIVCLISFVCHLLLAVVFVMYFFSATSSATTMHIEPPVVLANSVNEAKESVSEIVQRDISNRVAEQNNLALDKPKMNGSVGANATKLSSLKKEIKITNLNGTNGGEVKIKPKR